MHPSIFETQEIVRFGHKLTPRNLLGWAVHTFGPMARDRMERAARLLEESVDEGGFLLPREWARYFVTGELPPEPAPSTAALESILALGFWFAAWLTMFALGMTVVEPVHQADFLRSMFVVAATGVALAGLAASWWVRSLGAAALALVLGGAVGLRLLFLIGG